MNFLQNVIDMHAIRCLSQSSHPLYQQSLSDLLCEHFQEEVKGQKDSSDPLTPEELLALQGENEVAWELPAWAGREKSTEEIQTRSFEDILMSLIF